MARKLEVTTRITHAGDGIDYPLVSAVGNLMARNDIFLSVVAAMVNPAKYHIMEYLFSGSDSAIKVTDWVTTFNRIFKYAVAEKNQAPNARITYVSGTVAEGNTITVSLVAAAQGTTFDVNDTWISPDNNTSISLVELVSVGAQGYTFKAITNYTTAGAARLAANLAVGANLVYLNHTVGEHSKRGKGLTANGGYSQRFNAIQEFRRSTAQTGRAAAAVQQMGNDGHLQFIQISENLSGANRQGLGVTIPDYVTAQGQSLIRATIEDVFNTMLFGLPNFNVADGAAATLDVTTLSSPDVLHMAGIRFQILNYTTPFTYSIREVNRKPSVIVDKLVQHLEQARIDCDVDKVDFLIVAGRGAARIIRDGFAEKNPTMSLNVTDGQKLKSVVDVSSIMNMVMHNGSITLAEVEFTSRLNNTVAASQNTYAYKGNSYPESEFEIMLIPKFTYWDNSTESYTSNIVPVTTSPNRRLYLGVVNGMTGAFKGQLSGVQYTGKSKRNGVKLEGAVTKVGFDVSGFETVSTGDDADWFHTVSEASVMMKSTAGAYLGLPKD